MKTAGFKNSFGKEGRRRKAAMHLIPNLFTTGNLFCGAERALFASAVLVMILAWNCRIQPRPLVETASLGAALKMKPASHEPLPFLLVRSQRRSAASRSAADSVRELSAPCIGRTIRCSIARWP